MNLRLPHFLVVSVMVPGCLLAPTLAEIPRHTRELLSRIPLVFEPTGAREGDRFVARGDGYQLSLTPGDATFHLTTPIRASCCGEADASSEQPTILRLKLAGANEKPAMEGLGKLTGVSHYLLGNDPAGWRKNVSHFGKVEYKEVYPGVDMVYYGNQRQLEFDFIVSPGADPDQIALDLEGALKLRLDERENLVAETALGDVVLHKPTVFQEDAGERREIPGRFELDSGNRVRFALGLYDPNKPLVIDPVVSFSTYTGGGSDGVAVDKSGNIYVVGSTIQQDLVTTDGALQPRNVSFAGDVFVMKFNPDSASIVYATYLGGSDYDFASGIAVDSEGNAIITGDTQSADFPLASAVQSQLGQPFGDAFVAKLDAVGSGLIYSTFLGGKSRIEVEPLSIDFGVVTWGQPKDVTMTIRNTGTIPFSVCALATTVTGGITYEGLYARFVGTTDSCATPNQHHGGNARITVPALSQASFVVQFSAPGRGRFRGAITIYHTSRGSGGRFSGYAANIPWIAEGRLPNSNLPPPPPLPPDLETYANEPPLAIFWGSGGTGSDSRDSGEGIAVDEAGNAYVVGTTQSANFPVLNAIQPLSAWSGTNVSLHDAFVAKFSPTGQLMFSTYIGGESDDGGGGIAVDREGNSYIAGNTGSADFPVTTSLHPNTIGNGFVMKLNAEGSARLYSTLLGASIYDIAVDDDGAAYITGTGGGENLPTPNAFQRALVGGGEAFVAKLNPGGSSLDYFSRLAGSLYDIGSAIAVDATGSAFVTGHTASLDFPMTDAVQPAYAGGDYDAFVTQLSPDGTAAVFSTYFGGTSEDAGRDIALDSQGRIVIAGYTKGNVTTTNPLQGWTNPNNGAYGSGFVAMFGGPVAQEVQLWQKLEIAAPTGNEGAAAFKVEFVRMIGGVETRVEAEILAVRPGFVTVRVPPGLLGPANLSAPPLEVDRHVRVEVLRASNRQEIARKPLMLRMPYPVIVDEVEVSPGSPGLRTLLQFVFNTGSPNIQTFSFLGRSTDGVVGLRVLNSELTSPAPLFFGADDIVVFEPGLGSAPLQRLLPFQIPNLGPGNQGVQFPVSKDGVHVFAIEPNAGSPGPFPASFQFHLAGNVGLPRSLVNGVAEHPRGTRLDTLFNHSAPRPQSLLTEGGTEARTAPFKFANLASISQFARAVLIPPAGGFANGTRIVRAADPSSPLELTTPTARTPDCTAPGIGTVIDFTQIPDPASVHPSPFLGGSVCAVIGRNDGTAVTLPMTLADGTVSSLILDMGSGHEIVDGTGVDFEVLAGDGSYTVQFGNTPFVGSFSAALGPFSGVRQIDIATAGLTLARYMWITAAPGVVLDAVRALNVVADEISPTIGPVTHVFSATITARRERTVDNQLDPFIQLIAPDGDFFGENETTLVNSILQQDGFYRYLVKGFDKLPDEQSMGTFFTRLETAGAYDQVELAVSSLGEAQTPAQRTGTFSSTRQRDSYLFQAAPGQTIRIVVNATGNGPKVNPVVELYDPEDFLIAANDDFPGRERNAALTATLPPQILALGTYRIVVNAVDEFGAASGFNGSVAHLREAASGGYELKVFTGALTNPPAPPDIDIQPVELDFGTVPVGQSKDLTLTIANKGQGVLRVSAITTSNARVTVVSPTVPFDVAPGGQQSVVVRLAPMAVGPVGFSLSVASNDPDEGSQSVSVAGRTEAPSLTADARLISLSLRLQRGQGTLFGDAYFLQLNGRLGQGAPSGELAFDTDLATPGDLLTFGNDPLFPSHVAAYTLEDAGGTPFSEGDIELGLPPMTDSNLDGIPDFLDVNRAVSGAKSNGEFFDFAGEGTIEATWNRPQGSVAGTVVMHLDGEFGGLPIVIDFTSTFELITYEGTFNYKPDAQAITGPVKLSLAGAEPGLGVDRTLGATLQISRQSPDALQLQATEWTNEGDGQFSAKPFALARMGRHYVTAVEFGADAGRDGFLTWMLDVDDGNDTDGDGIPDLSDDATVVPPGGVEAWRAASFPANVLSDPGKEATVWGDLANPDGDPLPNLLEYFTGSNALLADPDAMRLERTPGGLPALIYRQAKNAPGVEGFPEWTPSLGDWRRDQVILEVISETADARMVRASFPALGGGKSGFARLAAERR